MTRRVRRRPGFSVTLEIADEDFIRPPRDAQRNWLLNRAMAEFGADLEALDALAGDFVAGIEALPGDDREQAPLDDGEIMEDWQIPLMRAMAETVAGADVDLLEIGFGRGVASGIIQDLGVRSHSIIECNASIVRRFADWKKRYPGRNISMFEGRWQDVLPSLGAFDAIFFHTYPLNEDEFVEQVAGSTTFAAHFFPHAAAHLKPGGAFTYMTNELDSLGRQHQRELFEHFSSVTMSSVTGLPVPQDVKDSWWSDRMIVVRAVR